MPFQSLEDFIRAADAAGEVKHVSAASRDEDVGCLTEIFFERNGPMLVFDKFAGYPEGFRVCANPVRTNRRLALALDLPLQSDALEIARLRRERRRTSPIAPAVVSNAPVLECVQEGKEVDLETFPFPLWHKGDGGRSTGAADIVVNRDPEGGRVNLEIGRVAIRGRNQAHLRLSAQGRGITFAERSWQAGKAAPVTVVLGCEPGIWLAASDLVPGGASAYDLAGATRGSPVEVVQLPLTGLPVPAHGEIVLEGELPPPTDKAADRGALGEWPGYYIAGKSECVFHVKRVYHRRKPIILGHSPSRPKTEPSVNLEIWDHLERSGIVDIAGVWGICNNLLTVISVGQRYPGHSKQALVTAAGFHRGDMNTYLMTVDDDIDPSNLAEVIWAMCTRVDPGTDIDVVRAVGTSDIDPRVSPARREANDLTVGRCLIDATKPYRWKDQFPKSNMWSRADRKEFEEKYHDMLARIGRARANI